MNATTIVLQRDGKIVTSITDMRRSVAEDDARIICDKLYGVGQWHCRVGHAGRNAINTRAIYWNVEVK